MFIAGVDLREFDKLVARTARQLETAMSTETLRSAERGATYARSHHPHKRRTGKLTSKAMLYARRVRSDRNGATAELRNDAPYARYVEYPTRPHIIRPKEGHGFVGPLKRGQSRRAIDDIGTHRVALRWYVGGRAVFAKMVRHPGTPGFAFMRPAGHEAGRELERALRLRIRKISKDVWKSP
jgi:hypothetical protein